ncbi:MAG: arginase family protein [Planctomycetota bacterium]
MDGLDASFCPGTGTPVPGGLSYAGSRLCEVVRTE